MGANVNVADNQLGKPQSDATAVKGLSVSSSSSTSIGYTDLSHKHSYTGWGSGSLVGTYGVSGSQVLTTGDASPAVMNHTHTATTTTTTSLSSTDSETRPKNARVNFIIYTGVIPQ